MAFLEAHDVTRRFGGTIALAGVDFAVDAGEVLALVGENGSGKSTLMRVLAGELPPDSGTLVLDGKPYTPQSPIDAHRHGVALIHQELALCGHLSVAENIVLGAEPTKAGGVMRRAQTRATARAALERLGHAGMDVDAPVRTLPVAMQQVVEIARALASGAKVVIFDEPTSSLTEADANHLFDTVRTLRDQGHAIVYITHFLDEVKRVADRYSVLRDGKAVGEGPVAETPLDAIITLMVGREVSELYPRSQRTPGETVLAATDLGGVHKPTSAGFELRRGEVLGIAGLTGSGRTELVRCIFGLDPVKKGQVSVAQVSGIEPPHRRWEQGVGMLSEDRKSEGLAVALSVAENLTLSKLGRHGLVSPKRQMARAQAWVEALGIRCRDPYQAVRELSGGNQQKVAVARLLHHDVDVLLLDEPTRGIDVGSKAEIYRLIDQLACQGKAVLVVSSYLPELLGICDRIAVMHRGVLGPARPTEQTSAEAIVQEAAGA